LGAGVLDIITSTPQKLKKEAAQGVTRCGIMRVAYGVSGGVAAYKLPSWCQVQQEALTCKGHDQKRAGIRHATDVRALTGQKVITECLAMSRRARMWNSAIEHIAGGAAD